MQAAILTELNKDLVIRNDVEVFGLGPRDVKINCATPSRRSRPRAAAPSPS